jgi:hypothetical protein
VALLTALLIVTYSVHTTFIGLLPIAYSAIFGLSITLSIEYAKVRKTKKNSIQALPFYQILIKLGKIGKWTNPESQKIKTQGIIILVNTVYYNT